MSLRAATVAAAVAAIGAGQPSLAATRTASFGVGATVVATCSLSSAKSTATAPAQTTCAAQTRGAPTAVVAPPPVVRVVSDPKTGARVRIVEF